MLIGKPVTMEAAVEQWVRRDPHVNVQPPITVQVTQPFLNGQVSLIAYTVVRQGKLVPMTALLFGQKAQLGWDISGGGAWTTTAVSATNPLAIYTAAEALDVQGAVLVQQAP